MMMEMPKNESWASGEEKNMSPGGGSPKKVKEGETRLLEESKVTPLKWETKFGGWISGKGGKGGGRMG